MEERREEKPRTLEYAKAEEEKCPRYRKILAGLLIGSGLILGGISIGSRTWEGSVHGWEIAGALVVWGLVIRYQHVRIW